MGLETRESAWRAGGGRGPSPPDSARVPRLHRPFYFVSLPLQGLFAGWGGGFAMSDDDSRASTSSSSSSSSVSGARALDGSWGAETRRELRAPADLLAQSGETSVPARGPQSHSLPPCSPYWKPSGRASPQPGSGDPFRCCPHGPPHRALLLSPRLDLLPRALPMALWDTPLLRLGAPCASFCGWPLLTVTSELPHVAAQWAGPWWEGAAPRSPGSWGPGWG